MTALPPLVDLGGGLSAAWVWGTKDDPFGEAEPEVGAIPAGVLIEHATDHQLLIAWVPIEPDCAAVTLESLRPLTITERVHCPSCGLTGKIEQDRWVLEGEAHDGR